MPEIRMLTDQSGTRADGQDWPARGNTLEVSEDEYGELINAGIAAPLAEGRGKRDPNKDKDRENRQKADSAGDSRANANELHARAAETRAAAKKARDDADDLERQADDQEADAADAQDEADEATKAEDELNGDREVHPGSDHRDESARKSRKDQGQAGLLP